MNKNCEHLKHILFKLVQLMSSMAILFFFVAKMLSVILDLFFKCLEVFFFVFDIFVTFAWPRQPQI